MYSTVREKGLGEYFIFTFKQRGGRGTLTTVNKIIYHYCHDYTPNSNKCLYEHTCKMWPFKQKSTIL